MNALSISHWGIHTLPDTWNHENVLEIDGQLQQFDEGKPLTIRADFRPFGDCYAMHAKTEHPFKFLGFA